MTIQTAKPMAQVVCQVLRTTDYSQFKTLQGNRELNPLHVERLTRSFQAKHLLSPIIVNQHFEIIDGQHRFETAKKLKLPVDYIVVNDYGLKEVQLLNSNTSNWRNIDYLNAYCDLGYTDYLIMRDFVKKYPCFTLQSAENLLANKTMSRNQKYVHVDGLKKLIGSQTNFSSGKFKVNNLELAIDMAEKLLMIKPFYAGYNNSRFVQAMITMFNNEKYNHSQFISKLAQQPTSLQPCANVKQYHLLIEEIYNYRSREKVSLRY